MIKKSLNKSKTLHIFKRKLEKLKRHKTRKYMNVYLCRAILRAVFIYSQHTTKILFLIKLNIKNTANI